MAGMRWSAVASTLSWLALVALTACHLAEDPDAPACGPGTHPNNGHCEEDLVQGPVITITSAGGSSSCAPSPASITVAPNASFQFKNEDSVEHAIVGADGKTWVSVSAGMVSPPVGITKAGSWKFTISGCATPGVVVVGG